MSATLSASLLWSSPWGRVLLIVHLLTAVFALGAVTHHGWLLLGRSVQPVRLAKYAKWMAIGYPLAWLAGVLVYPAYNVFVRKPPLGILETSARWAVGLFEIKEHAGTIALLMLPWLVLSARRYANLARFERVSYRLAAWVFALLVYYSFVAGGLVTMVRSLP